MMSSSKKTYFFQTKCNKMYFLLVLFVHSLEISPIFPSLTPPTARRLLTAAYYSINNSVYLFGGGRNTDDSYTNTVWRYDLSLFQWKKIDFNSPVAPSPRIGAAGSIYLDFIFIYGGESDNGPSADMWKFDLTRLLWTEIGKSPDWPLETSFSAYCTFEFKGSAYMAMFGGMQSEGPGHDLYL